VANPENPARAPLVDAQALVVREKEAFATHKASLRGGRLPPPREAPRGTFVHGLLLPLSLLAVTLRNPDLRRPFLRLFVVRVIVVALLGVFALSCGDSDDVDPKPGVHVSRTKPHVPDGGTVDALNVDIPGLHLHVGEPDGGNDIEVLGQKIPVEEQGADVAPPDVPRALRPRRASDASARP